jgi:hypothetical protein
MGVLNLDEIAGDKNGGLYTAQDVRKLYEYGGIRLAPDAVAAIKRICKTPQSGRLRTCNHIVSALHTSPSIREAGCITANNIVQAIEQLDLPIRMRLPFTIGDIRREAGSEQTASAVG